MTNVVIRILTIIIMIPIMCISITIAIIWNIYLITDSIIAYIKRRGFIGGKRKGKGKY
jgi:hypothetical protein